MRRRRHLLASLCLLLAAQPALGQGMDPDNPTCPKAMNWSTYRQMRFTLETIDGHKILRAEGVIDEGAPERLKQALAGKVGDIEEMWIRSPGGDARAGNAIGKLIRDAGIPTRIPNGWACFSACNFVFMGGPIRAVDEGGVFAVHMFTHLTPEERTRLEAGADVKNTVVGIEQDSAMLASEDNDFLLRMGVSRKLLTDVMYKQKAVADAGDDRSTRRCLTPAEVKKYNVATVALPQ